MNQLSSELLKIKKQARLVAEMIMYTEISNRETSIGGWLSDCNVKMGEAAENAANLYRSSVAFTARGGGG